MMRDAVEGVRVKAWCGPELGAMVGWIVQQTLTYLWRPVSVSQSRSRNRTYIKIKASAHGLKTPVDKVGCPLRNAIEGLRPDNVGIGVAVCEGPFSPGMLETPSCQHNRRRVQLGRQ
jgi:hypothetical protein